MLVLLLGISCLDLGIQVVQKWLHTVLVCCVYKAPHRCDIGSFEIVHFQLSLIVQVMSTSTYARYNTVSQHFEDIRPSHAPLFCSFWAEVIYRHAYGFYIYPNPDIIHRAALLSLEDPVQSAVRNEQQKYHSGQRSNL